jgi:D-alanine-D-alanine ligase
VVKPQRVLVLVHKHLVPPETTTPEEARAAEWRTEWDVISTLKARGHELLTIGVQDDLSPIRQSIEEFKPAIVFNLIEAFDGVNVFDQNVVSYLELLRMPYTGCNPRGLILARDKSLAKKLLAYHRIPAPGFTVVPMNRRAQLPKSLRFPMIVKSLTYEASIGISQASVVDTDEKLKERVEFIHESIRTAAIVEQYIEGRELTVAVIGEVAYPVVEIEPKSGFYDYASKYTKGASVYTCPAKLSTEMSKHVRELGLEAAQSLDCSGVSRVDLRLSEDDEPYVLEVNTLPGMTPTSLVPMAAAAKGMSYDQLVARILDLALADARGRNVEQRA